MGKFRHEQRPVDFLPGSVMATDPLPPLRYHTTSAMPKLSFSSRYLRILGTFALVEHHETLPIHADHLRFELRRDRIYVKITPEVCLLLPEEWLCAPRVMEIDESGHVCTNHCLSRHPRHSFSLARPMLRMRVMGVFF